MFRLQQAVLGETHARPERALALNLRGRRNGPSPGGELRPLGVPVVHPDRRPNNFLIPQAVPIQATMDMVRPDETRLKQC